MCIRIFRHLIALLSVGYGLPIQRTSNYYWNWLKIPYFGCYGVFQKFLHGWIRCVKWGWETKKYGLNDNLMQGIQTKIEFDYFWWDRNFSFFGVTKWMFYVSYDDFGMSYSEEFLQKFYIRKVHIMLNIFYFCHVSLRWIVSTIHPVAFKLLEK